jgi:hypothetical protein
MSIPITAILEVNPPGEYNIPAHIIVSFKDKIYRVQKGGPIGPELNVFVQRRGKGFHVLKTVVGKGIFKDMLKKVIGLKLPAGFKP